MWEIDLSWQIQTFLWSFVLGAAFCIGYDTLSITEQKLSFSKVAVFTADMLYFIFIGFVDFCFFLATCNGEIRGFVFIGEIIGFFLCKKTVSRIYSLVLLLIFKTAQGFFALINRLIIAPLSAFFKKTGKITLKISKKTVKFIKKGLKKPKWLVYTKEKCPKDRKREDALSEY